MRFYTKKHNFYCGIDLHATKMYLCILNQQGKTVFHRNIKTRPDLFLHAVLPFREDLVVSAECMFAWYWLADLCEDHGIPFILGHALYMRAIHGGKIGNAHLLWVFSQAAQLFLKGNEQGKKYHQKLVNKHNKDKALSILAHKLGRAVYYMLKNQKTFAVNKFFNT